MRIHMHAHICFIFCHINMCVMCVTNLFCIHRDHCRCRRRRQIYERLEAAVFAIDDFVLSALSTFDNVCQLTQISSNNEVCRLERREIRVICSIEPARDSKPLLVCVALWWFGSLMAATAAIAVLFCCGRLWICCSDLWCWKGAVHFCYYYDNVTSLFDDVDWKQWRSL